MELWKSRLLVVALLVSGAVGCTSTNTEKLSEDRERAVSQSPQRTDKTADAFEANSAADTTADGAAPAAATAEGLAWDVPGAFKPVVPSSAMRIAQYELLATEQGVRSAELSLFFFGAGIGGKPSANVDRWIEQFRQPDGSDPRQKAVVDSFTVASGLRVMTVQLSGIYEPQSMDDKPTFDLPGYALYGAVIEGKGGPWFFKAVGPEAVVAHHREALRRLFCEVRLAP